MTEQTAIANYLKYSGNKALILKWHSLIATVCFTIR